MTVSHLRRKTRRPLANQTFESQGPEGRIRGTPAQIMEKYIALARDAFAAGDRVLGERFYQHADHYARLLGADEEGSEPRQSDRSQSSMSEESSPSVEEYEEDPLLSADPSSVSENRHRGENSRSEGQRRGRVRHPFGSERRRPQESASPSSSPKEPPVGSDITAPGFRVLP